MRAKPAITWVDKLGQYLLYNVVALIPCGYMALVRTLPVPLRSDRHLL